MGNKIAVGLVTRKREDYYKKVIEKIPRDSIDYFVVVNAGPDYYATKSDADTVIYHRDAPIGENKNLLLGAFKRTGFDYFFLVEDDVIIKRPDVFSEYVETADVMGLCHLNFYGGAECKNPPARGRYKKNGKAVDFYFDAKGCFTYWNRMALDSIKWSFDEGYINAFEHVDHEVILCTKKLSPPFWWFPDIASSDDYLEMIEGCREATTISKNEKYFEWYQKSSQHFRKKWGFFVKDIMDVEPEEVKKTMDRLYELYSKNKS